MDVERNSSTPTRLRNPERRSLTRASSHDSLLGNDNDALPRDKAGFILVGFLIMGITTLVPWNSFVTATDYWMYKFRNVTHPEDTQRTSLQTFFESYLSIASTLPIVVAMILTSLFGQRFKQESLIKVPLILTLVTFLITTILAIVNTDHIQYIFLGLTIIMVTCIGFLSAVFQAALFGYTANFPHQCMHAMVNGQAVAGLLVTSVQLVTLAGDFGPKTGGIGYFAISTLFIATALVYYRFMDNDYTRHYSRLAASSSAEFNLLESSQELMGTISDCWQKALTVSIVFIATLSVFPAVCVLVAPQYPDSSFLTGRFFIPIMAFLIYNSSDLLGRILSSVAPWPHGCQNLLLLVSMVRVLIPAMIIFCNVVVPGRTLTVLFKQDLHFGLLVSLTGLTQGYLFSSAMVLASTEAKPERRELTGFIMATCLGIGLAGGSLASTLLISLLEN